MDFIVGIATLISSFIFLLISQKYFLKKKIVDEVVERSSHNGIATRSGGLGIFTTLFLISVYYYFIGIQIFDYSLVIPLSILLIVGLYDDLYNVDFKLKFLFQIITAKILIDNGLIIDNFHGILGLYELNRIFSQIFSVFVIVAIINSINFIDGIDGLAVLVVSLFIILFEFFALNQTPYSVLSMIILFSLIPFLYFNLFSKNKVFLGDSGSLLLGGLVSIYVLHILSNNYLIKAEYDVNKVLFVISILTYPIIDIIRVFFIRIFKGKSPFVADKNHIHHIVLKKVKSHWMTTFLIIILSSLFTVLVQIIF
jgi:UDP-GlcNAc:undecaprenyl-phosphate GlcNAc-1-phosphate transferase